MAEGTRRPSPRQGAQSEGPAETAAQALARARRHARRAVAETIAATRALLDAATLGAVGHPAEETAALAMISRALDDLGEQLSGETESAPLVEAVLSALDAEIARWELRSRDDPDARAVLRAFFGLREILWEFGMRRGDGGARRSTTGAGSTGGEADSSANPRRRTRPRRSAPRVQRVKVK